MTEHKTLVVVAGVETSSHVMAAAIDYAETEGTSLVVLHVMPLHVYENRQRSMGEMPNLRYDGFTFDLDQAEESAESVAERAAQAAIGDRDIAYTAVGRVGDLISTVLAAAAAHRCETIVLSETEPWWRRALGQADRRLAKQFNGTVVRVPRPFPANLRTTRQLPQR